MERVMKGVEKKGDEDRLSQLTEDILHRIIFFVQIKSVRSAARLGLSSKACHQAYVSNPRIFLQCSTSFQNKTYFVERTLHRAVDNDTHINTLGLIFGYMDPFSINQCMKLVGSFNLKLIHLHFVVNCDVRVPTSVFTHISLDRNLQELSLQRCKLMPYDDVLSMPSLKRLILKELNADSYTLERIIKGCTSLEHLEVITNTYFRSLHVSGLSNLKSFIIDSHKMSQEYQGQPMNIGIEAPYLREFSCSWTTIHMPTFNVTSWSCLKKLSFKEDISLHDNDLAHLLSQLLQLQHLSLFNCAHLKNPKVWSHSITTIELKAFEMKAVFQISCPNLRNIYILNTRVPDIHHEGAYNSAKKIDVNFTFTKDIFFESKDVFFAQFKSIIRDRNIRVSSFKIVVDKSWITKGRSFNKERIGNDLLFGLGPYRPNIKHLKLDLKNFSYFPTNFIDEFLWICQPDLIVLTFQLLSKVLKSVRKIMKKTGGIFECGCQSGQCWHHSLKDVEYDWSWILIFDKESNFEPVNLEALSEQVLHKPRSIRLSVRIRLAWQ